MRRSILSVFIPDPWTLIRKTDMNPDSKHSIPYDVWLVERMKDAPTGEGSSEESTADCQER